MHAHHVNKQLKLSFRSTPPAVPGVCAPKAACSTEPRRDDPPLFEPFEHVLHVVLYPFASRISP